MAKRKITEDPTLRETKCYICGRVFVPAPQHVYHRNGKWCCKWSCFCRLLDEIEAKKKKGTFASAAGGRESEQKGVAAVAEGEGAEQPKRDAVTATGREKKKGE